MNIYGIECAVIIMDMEQLLNDLIYINKLWNCNKPLQEMPVTCGLWYFFYSFFKQYTVQSILTLV